MDDLHYSAGESCDCFESDSLLWPDWLNILFIFLEENPSQPRSFMAAVEIVLIFWDLLLAWAEQHFVDETDEPHFCNIHTHISDCALCLAFWIFHFGLNPHQFS